MPSFDYTPPPYDGPPAAEILDKRQRYLSPAIFHFYKNPVCLFNFIFLGISIRRCSFLLLLINPFFFYGDGQLNLVDGKMQYLFDDKGRRYLDAFGGIATVCCGHCHPQVVDAIINQTKRLQHSTVLYLNHAITDFAEALASKLPGDLKVNNFLILIITTLITTSKVPFFSLFFFFLIGLFVFGNLYFL